MRLKWLELASLAHEICTLYIFSSMVHSLLPKRHLYKKILYIWTILSYNKIDNITKH